MGSENSLKIYTDGGARGNPGPAAYGVYIEDPSGNMVTQFGKTIGITTNNVAEYSGVLAALDWVLENKQDSLQRIYFFMDSQLVVNQLGGVYKIKNENLRKIIDLIREKEQLLGIPISFSHVPREKNTQADKMVNVALDNH